MSRTINTRVIESFRDSTHEDVTKYLEWLRATMEALAQNLRRTIVLTLILIAAFELVNGSPKTVVAIGPFKLAGGSIVLIFIPAIVSFLLYQAAEDTYQLSTRQAAFSSVFTLWSSEGEGNDLDLWVMPPQVLYWNVRPLLPRRANRTLWDAVQVRLEDVISIIMFIGTLVFLIQSYVILHSTASHYRVLWVISVCVAVYCSVAASIRLTSIDW